VHPASATSRLFLALAWCACAAALYAFPARARCRLRDPDSVLHESLVSSLARRQPSEWIAPTWPPGYWRQGVFFEHPACFFWLPALLERAGIRRAALLANVLYVLASLQLLFRLTRRLAGRAAAWAAVGSYALSPLGVQQLLRANHEPALAAAFLGAFASLEGRPRPARCLLFVACAVLACAAKGALGLLVLPAALAWGTARGRRPHDLRWLATAAAAIAGAAALYEYWFRAATGASFFGAYLASQLLGIAEAERAAGWWKLAIPLYYALNLFWFALPGAQLFAVGLWRTTPRHLTPAQCLGLAAGGTCVAAASIFSRHAARYIFPAYALCQVPGAEEACRRWPRLRDSIERNAAVLPYALMAALLAVAAARVWLDPYLFRFISLP
jgi:4-amino-4-deoxy-L-arabinose transferase-like glycosyltransferase